MDCNPIALVDPLGAAAGEGDPPTTMSPGGESSERNIDGKVGVYKKEDGIYVYSEGDITNGRILLDDITILPQNGTPTSEMTNSFSINMFIPKYEYNALSFLNLPSNESKSVISNFEKYQKEVFDHEGGFVNDPDDPGGATNKGITLSTFKAFAKKDLGIEPTLDNLKKLTNEQASVIYKNNYWNKVKGDDINNGSIAYAIYDFNVNAGNNAITVLQKTLNELGANLTVDGKIGSMTIQTINSTGSFSLFHTYQANRKKYYEKIIKKNSKLKKYKKGWFKRVDSIEFELEYNSKD